MTVLLRSDQRQRVLESMRAFLETSLDEVLDPAEAADPRRAAEAALSLFRAAVREVPAYRVFLAEHGVEPREDAVATLADFERLPLVTKDNYLRRYPLPELCRGGALDQCEMVAVSSGSTGAPTFWPRSLEDELHVARRFEQAFHDSFRADERTTLAIVCFALGTWVGGIFTATCCRQLAARGYPITLVTPGNNKAEILRVLDQLGPLFDQVVLLGYPPFLKDVVDSGRAEGIDWSRFRPKLVMAGEVFSEEWRTLMAERIGSNAPCLDFASLYGTADAGVLGLETPLSITIRRFLADQPDAARDLFGESRLPTLVQYDPRQRYFEARDGTLIFSGWGGVPLVRYHLADAGGVVPYPQMLDFLATRGFDPRRELARPDREVRPLPFVFVFGRADFTISYFGANVFPENVTVGLEQAPIKEWVTGKFVMQARETAARDRELWIVVELAPGAEASQARADTIADSILRHLLRLNSEFAHYVPPEYQRPRVELAPAGDPVYFPVGVKHRYTRR